MPPIYVNSEGQAATSTSPMGNTRAVSLRSPQSMSVPPGSTAQPVPGSALSTEVITPRPTIDMGMIKPVSNMRRVMETAGKLAGPATVGMTGAETAAQVGNTPTEDYYRRTGIDPVATHVPQVMKDVGVRALGAAQDLGNNLTFGLADRVGNALAGNGLGHSTAFPTEAPGPTAGPAGGAAAAVPAGGAASLRAGMPAAAPAPAPAGGGRGFVNPPAVTPAPATNPNGVVLRDGNSFSGNNIKEGFSYQDAKTGQVTDPTQRVTTMPAGTMSQLDPALAARLHEAKMAAIGRGESLGPGGVAGINGSSHGNMRGGTDIQKLAESGKLTAAGLNAVLGARGQDISADTTMRGQDIGAQTAQGQMGVQSQGQLLQHDAALRGQDVAMAGHMMSNQVARAQARMQQMQQDRQFNLEKEKFGEEKAKTAFAQREQATKDLQSRFEGQLIDPATGKADPTRVAEHMSAVNSFMADAIAKAEAVPKDAPGYAQAQALAEKLRSEGVKAIGEDRLQQITLGLKAKHLNAQNSSPFNPFMGTQVNSTNPDDYKITGIEKHTFAPNQYVHANGARTPVNVFDRQGGSPVINIGKAKSTEFDPLKGAR